MHRGIDKAVTVLLALNCAACATRTARTNATAEGIFMRTGKPIRAAASSNNGGLPPGASLDRPLAADDAVGIALWNNAQLRADLAAIGLAEADLMDAGLLRNPRLDLLVPVGAKPFEMLLNMPLDALWQRPRRVAVFQSALAQLAESLIQNGLDTARDARWAHSDLVQATQRVSVARESAQLRDRIVELTAARLRAGDISELETVAARTEAGSAREQLVRFERDVELALERLRFALGLSAERAPLRVSLSAPEAAAPASIDILVEKALSSRPDLRAAEIAIATAARRAKWERSRIQVLAGQLSSKEVGTNGVLTGPGASLELPMFHRNQGLVARAEAEVEIASRQYLALRQRVAFEIAEARAQLVQAQESLRKLREDVLPPLERAETLAQDQYRDGDVAYLFVLEQTRGLVDAKLRVIDTQAAIRRAEAQLERSVGSR